MAEWLDSTEGHTVNDHSVFSSLAQKYSVFDKSNLIVLFLYFRFESDFFLDMEHLNVMKPTVLTRVSQYIPEIIAFIQRIIKNGYAYETKSGSVSFFCHSRQLVFFASSNLFLLLNTAKKVLHGFF